MKMKPGFAFAEHVKTEKIKRRKYDEELPMFRMRNVLLLGTLIVAAGILVTKLFSLQIAHGNTYRQLADSNRMRSLIIHAPRGIIYDRQGTPLALNLPGFLKIVKDPTSPTGIKVTHITKEEALSLIAKGEKDIAVDSLRQYPYKDSLAHVIGYMGQISEDEIKEPEFADYQTNDWIGKSGIEQSYEHTLHGRDGQQLIEVDALGKPVRALGQTDPVAGQDVALTIDAKLQNATYKAAKNIKKGAVIVSKPDGAILAMVSLPSYDPNLFTLDQTYKTATDAAYTSLQAVLTDTENYPLLNRAIGGIYPPGSTFKLVTAIAGLQNHIIDEHYQVTDTGVLKLGEFSFANWYYTEYGKKEPGELNVVRALARSNDIFFYELAEKIGVEKLSATAKAFGIGNLLGIDIQGEAAGLVPTKQWKQVNLKEGWYLGDTYHYGIGQGFLLTTPLQVNAWTQVVANGGTLFRPRLNLNQEANVLNQGLLSKKTIGLVRDGMIHACSTGGVAWPLFDFKVKNSKLTIDNKDFQKVASGSADMRKVAIACKTGTAQHGGEDTLPHAWITLFAPAYNPEVVVTVLSESSGEGSNVAAPVAKKILEAYFGSKN